MDSVKLYTIYTKDGGYWLSPESPFLTQDMEYAKKVLGIYVTQLGVHEWVSDGQAYVVELNVEQRVWDGTDDRVNTGEKNENY